jgi:hypothetical protein
MDTASAQAIIQNAKDMYCSLGPIPCPAFGGEEVHFNRHGWRHLMQKGRKIRELGEKVKRVSLLHYAPQILATVRQLADYTEVKKDNSCIRYWAAHQKINNVRLRLIIRQSNNGKKHFYSIMTE